MAVVCVHLVIYQQVQQLQQLALPDARSLAAPDWGKRLGLSE